MASEKFKALVHFIIDECADPARLGAVRLNKICWYSDVISYKETGTPITDERYVKRKMGPVPATILSALRQLEESGAIAISERDFGRYTRRDFMARRAADTSLLSENDMNIVKTVVNAICDGHSASSISEMTHDQVWDAATEGEVIPLFATLAANPGPISAGTMEWANAMLAEIEAEEEAA